jgi:hypothetical protein
MLVSFAWLVITGLLIHYYKHYWSLIRFLELQYDHNLFRVDDETKHGARHGDSQQISPNGEQAPIRSRPAVLSNLDSPTGVRFVRLLATSLTTGELCSFDGAGFHHYGDTQVSRHNPKFPLARAVAASSAFPVLFSPVIITPSDFGTGKSDIFPQALADGGIYDNFGLECFDKLFSTNDWASRDELVLSDGQAVYCPCDRRSFAMIPSRADRAIAILMNRVSKWQVEKLKPSAQANPLRFRPIRSCEEVKAKWALTAPEQGRVARIRTDLDAFSEAEIRLLVYHGFCAARFSYEVGSSDEAGENKAPPVGAYTESWEPVRESSSTRDSVLVARRPWYILVWREIKRPLNYATLTLLALLAWDILGVARVVSQLAPEWVAPIPPKEIPPFDVNHD